MIPTSMVAFAETTDCFGEEGRGAAIIHN